MGDPVVGNLWFSVIHIFEIWANGKEAKTSQKYEFVHFRMTVNSGFVDSRFGIWSDEHVTIQWFNKDLVDWLVKYN